MAGHSKSEPRLIMPWELLTRMQEELEKFGGYMDITRTVIPKIWVECTQKDREANIELLMRFEEIPDIDAAYHNMQ